MWFYDLRQFNDHEQQQLWEDSPAHSICLTQLHAIEFKLGHKSLENNREKILKDCRIWLYSLSVWNELIVTFTIYHLEIR